MCLWLTLNQLFRSAAGLFRNLKAMRIEKPLMSIAFLPSWMRTGHPCVRCLLGFFLILVLSWAIAGVSTIISFYDPETNISSFTSLKVSFDNYLSKHTNYRLQPFKDRAVFQALNADKTDPVMLISSWQYGRLSAALRKRIEPALIAVKNGEIRARKILAAKRSYTSLANLHGAVIASAADAEYTHELLKYLFRNQPDSLLNSITVLSVPKEIDALMAVAYGVADGAIVYEDTQQKLAQISPNQSALLHVLARTRRILLPLLFLPKKMNQEEAQLIDVFLHMPNTEEGRQKLKLIGFDGWRVVDRSVMNELELGDAE